MPDRIRLDGRVAVVTGAAGVIGTATIRLLAERGARIVAVDRREQDLQGRDQGPAGLGRGARDHRRRHRGGRGRRLCPRRRRQVRHHRRLLQQCRHRGRHQADHANIRWRAFAACSTSTWSASSSGMKHVLPVMLKQNKGSIINTASIAGLIGSPHIAVYSASKHAVIGLTKSAAWECTGTGVRVNCVCPGLIDSRMLSAIIAGPQSRQRAAAEREDRRADSGAPARTGLRGRLHRGVPRLRRSELRLRLRLHRRRRPNRRLNRHSDAQQPESTGHLHRLHARRSRSRCRRRLQGLSGSRPPAL